MEKIHGIGIRHLNLFRERLSTLRRDQAFMEIAPMFIGASYNMGSENFEMCDCSGLICSTLNGLGYEIRVNANDIMNSMVSDYKSTNKLVKLVGFYNSSQSRYTHIGIIYESPSDDMILHASYPKGCCFEDYKNCTDRYKSKGYTIKRVQLDWDKIKLMDGKVYDMDSDFI